MADNPKRIALEALARKGWEDFKEGVSNTFKPITEPLGEAWDASQAKAQEAEDNLVKGNVERLNQVREAQGKPHLSPEEEQNQVAMLDMAKNVGMSAGSIGEFGSGPKFGKLGTIVEEMKIPTKAELDALKRSSVENASDEVVEGLVPQGKLKPSKPMIRVEMKVEPKPEGQPSWEHGAPVAQAPAKRLEDYLRSKPQYHGTGVDINEYKLLSPGDKLKAENSSMSDAIFFTDKPSVASEFAESRVDPNWNPRVYKNAVAPKNTFDPKDPNKVKALLAKLVDQGMEKDNPFLNTLEEELKHNKNNWHLLESPKVQDAMKASNFDSFIVNEVGNNNLGVLDPSIVEQAATKGQRKVALEKLKQRELKSYIDKIMKSDKEAYEAMGASPKLTKYPIKVDPSATIDRSTTFHKNAVEDLPIDWVKKLEGGNKPVRLSTKEYNALKEDIAKNGIKDPLIITYDRTTGKAQLGEGNHRFKAAQELGLTHVPVIAMPGGGRTIMNMSKLPKKGNYFPSEAPPSSIFEELTSDINKVRDEY